MNQVREVAMAYYARATAEEQQTAKQFFRSLDANGDGRVSLAEYKNAVSSWFTSNQFFDALDQNGDGTLDFEEVLTLYYMQKSCIRVCDGCRAFLMGSYFSCLLCEIDRSYDLCCDCYRKGEFSHGHSTEYFLDDRSMRVLLVQCICMMKADKKQESSVDTVGKMKSLLQSFNAAVNIGSAIGTVAAVSGCSIM